MYLLRLLSNVFRALSLCIGLSLSLSEASSKGGLDLSLSLSLSLPANPPPVQPPSIVTSAVCGEPPRQDRQEREVVVPSTSSSSTREGVGGAAPEVISGKNSKCNQLADVEEQAGDMDRDTLKQQISNMHYQAKMERWPLSKSIEA